MKKIATLFFTLLFLTGCTVVRIDTKSIDNIISVILSKENTLYNRIGKGYKYYVPRGVNYIDTNALNDKLYSNGIYYYLYIDAVSYFYKKKVNYQENPNSYYSKKIEDEKGGYLEINKEDSYYSIEFFYNYAKIEAKVKKKDIESVILNASYILSTVKFNDNIIELMLNEEYFTNKEEKYNLFEKDETKSSDNFIQYIEN